MKLNMIETLFTLAFFASMTCNIGSCLFLEKNLYNENPGCKQLGCEVAGRFVQGDFIVPTNANRKQVWVSRKSHNFPSPVENINYGCVGDGVTVACPFMNSDNSTGLILLDPQLGKEDDYSDYDVLRNISMPIITKTNEVLIVNNTHISLINPEQKSLMLTPLPTIYEHGVHSPIYLPDVDLYLVTGNFSTEFLLYQVGERPGNLRLMKQFTVPKNGKDCGWIPVTEVVARKNRIFFFGLHKDDADGVVAVDILDVEPYFNKAWELTDDGSSVTGVKMPDKGSSTPTMSGNDECVIIPPMDPEYAWFPPDDLQMQLTATNEGFIIITSAVGLIAVQDEVDKGEQVFITLFGAHFLSVDERDANHSIVWMTGWSIYPPFKSYLIGFNHSATTSEDAIIAIDLLNSTGATNINITSRITLFHDPERLGQKIAVFGVSLNTASKESIYHTKYCPLCEVGVNRALVAVRPSYTSTEVANIVWIYPLPTDMIDYSIQGQVIGVTDKLIFSASNGTQSFIMAIS